MLPHPPLPGRTLASIPTPPKSMRSLRYSGDDGGIDIDNLYPADRDAVRDLYRNVGTLLRALHDGSDTSATVGEFERANVVECARRIGVAPYEAAAVRQALHDVRGGTLTSLAVLAQRHQRRPESVSSSALRVLAADQLKIMRQALLGLDDTRRQADMAYVSHPAARLAQTLAAIASEHASIDVDCRYDGAITTSCMEMGLVDRAAVNLANNAVREARRSPVRATLAPASQAPPADLRITFENAVEADYAAQLSTRFGGDLSRLFIDRYTTTGSGEGMRSCADMVAAAYGFAGAAEAARSGLVGAYCTDDLFVAWLHWPAVV